jgi:hypothetical protein
MFLLGILPFLTKVSWRYEIYRGPSYSIHGDGDGCARAECSRACGGWVVRLPGGGWVVRLPGGLASVLGRRPRERAGQSPLVRSLQ